MPGPLDGVKVVDLSQVVAGPFAAMLLADQGADVIKVEPLGQGDLTRVPAYAKGGLNSFYLNNNRGKRSLSVDLSNDEAVSLVLEVCRDADVFLENFRPGATERLGLGYEAIRAVNPDIIYVSISGFGATGPYASRPVLDPVIQGLCGIVDRQINPQIPFPDLIRNLYCDKTTALTTSQAITAALFARERGAGGQLIEVPMLDASMYMFWPDGMMDKTLTDDDVSPGFLLGEVYQLTDCSDGKIIYFAASDKQRASVSNAVGRPDWAEDPRFMTTAALMSDPQNLMTLGELWTGAFAEMTVDAALAALVEADVPCGPVLTADEALVDAQLVHNQTLIEWQHPDAGTVRQPRPAARFAATPAEPTLTGSHRGQDNEAILTELGKTADEIAALAESGAIG